MRFIDMVCALPTGERLEVIEVADLLKERLRDAAYEADDRKMLVYLILIEISKNDQHVKAISMNDEAIGSTTSKGEALPSSPENTGPN